MVHRMSSSFCGSWVLSSGPHNWSTSTVNCWATSLSPCHFSCCCFPLFLRRAAFRHPAPGALPYVFLRFPSVCSHMNSSSAIIMPVSFLPFGGMPWKFVANPRLIKYLPVVSTIRYISRCIVNLGVHVWVLGKVGHCLLLSKWLASCRNSIYWIVCPFSTILKYDLHNILTLCRYLGRLLNLLLYAIDLMSPPLLAPSYFTPIPFKIW